MAARAGKIPHDRIISPLQIHLLVKILNLIFHPFQDWNMAGRYKFPNEQSNVRDAVSFNF